MDNKNNTTRRTGGVAQMQSSGGAAVVVGTGGKAERLKVEKLKGEGLISASQRFSVSAFQEVGPCLRALVAIEAASDGVRGEEVRDFARGYVAGHVRRCAAQGRDSEVEARALLRMLLGTAVVVMVVEPHRAAAEPAEAGTTNSKKGGHGV